MLHLYTRLRLNIPDSVLALLCAQALVSLTVRTLELHVRRGTWPHKDGDPIPYDIPLRERAMAIRLDEFLGIQQLSRRLAAPS